MTKRPILTLKKPAPAFGSPIISDAAKEAESRPLKAYVIYGPNNTDHEGKFVVRLWETNIYGMWETESRGPLALADDIRHARSAVPFGLACFQRNEDDPPAILETWF